jgi:hypothetical protein
VKTLADAIKADILRERPAAPTSPTCFLCDRTFSEGKGFGINGRFCSTLCLNAFDAGFTPRDQSVRSVLNVPLRDWVVVAGPPDTVGTRPYGDAQPMTVSGYGFLITCKGCHKPFVSKGLRCCSTECDRQHRERQEIEATIAGMAMESTGYVKRKCEHCGNPLPRYVGTGKKRKQSTKRFCSPRCQQAAKRAEIVSDAPVMPKPVPECV